MGITGPEPDRIPERAPKEMPNRWPEECQNICHCMDRSKYIKFFLQAVCFFFRASPQGLVKIDYLFSRSAKVWRLAAKKCFSHVPHQTLESSRTLSISNLLAVTGMPVDFRALLCAFSTAHTCVDTSVNQHVCSSRQCAGHWLCCLGLLNE